MKLIGWCTAAIIGEILISKGLWFEALIAAALLTLIGTILNDLGAANGHPE
jgi:uncharacterized membrane protein YvlD (DUF360 family)